MIGEVVWKLRPEDRIHRSVIVGGIFSPEEIKNIKSIAANVETKPGFVGKSGEQKEIRKCQIKWLPPEEGRVWVYQRLVDVIQNINSQYFNLNLYGLETLQYTIYDADNNEFYAAHRDVHHEFKNNLVRKLTFSLQLSDPSEYEGGDLVINVGFDPITASKLSGDITFFMADSVHEAKPVTKGTRHVLVVWVSGPPVM